MRGEHDGAPASGASSASSVERVGVDHHRHRGRAAARQGRPPRHRRRSRPPRPAPVRRRPRPPARRAHRQPPRRPRVAHHAGRPRKRTADAAGPRRRCSRPSRPRRRPRRGCTCSTAGRSRQQLRDLRGLQHRDGAGGQVETDVDQLDHARRPAPGPTTARLEHAEGHGDVGAHRDAVDLAGRRVDAARHVDGDHQACSGRRRRRRPPPPAARRARRCRGSRRDQVRASRATRVDDPAPARRSAASPASCTRSASSSALDPRAAARPAALRQERVAAVVATADQQHDPRAVDPPQQVGAHRARGRSPRAASACRPAGSRAARCSAARTVSTSSAVRTSSSTMHDGRRDARRHGSARREYVARRARSLARSTEPRMVRCGLPSWPRSTSASRQCSPTGAPSAFAGPPWPRSGPPARPAAAAAPPR